MGVPSRGWRKGFVRGDQCRPFRQGRGEVQAVVDRLIEVKGVRLSGRHITRRRQQLDWGRLDCRQGCAGEIASDNATLRLRP